MSYSIEIDQELCISSGKCVADEPGVFAFDEAELAIVIGAHDALGDARLLRLARNCPGQAILLRTADGTPVEP